MKPDDRRRRIEAADELVDLILHLTGWTQVRLARELRQAARSLHGAEPIGLDTVTVNRWRRGRQTPGPYYSAVLDHLYNDVIRRSFEPGQTDPQRRGLGAGDVDLPEDVKRRHFLRYLSVLAAGQAESQREAMPDADVPGEALDVRPRAVTKVRLLDRLAQLLPAEERSRFVAEAWGNLAYCDNRQQRVAHLVGLALGMPCLAWMMWRENRRGRA